MTVADGYQGMDHDARCRWVAENLGGDPISAPLSADDAAALVSVIGIHNAEAGNYLFSRDDEPDRVFVVERGRVILCRRNADRTSILQIMKTGEIFGDGAIRSA